MQTYVTFSSGSARMFLHLIAKGGYVSVFADRQELRGGMTSCDCLQVA